jgi:methionyl-tRNA formyltransferase
MAKIAICGYWRFSNVVQFLSQAHQIERLFICPQTAELGVSLNGLSPEKITTSPIKKADIIDLAKQGVTRLYVGGYPYKIPSNWPEHLEMAVNIHPSLLPEGRGPTAEPHLILNSANTSGVTLHKISPNWDGGDIISQGSFGISNHDTSISLLFKSRLLALEMIKNFETNSLAMWQAAQAQTEVLPYWPRHSLAEKTIDWNWTVEYLLKHTRAFSNLGAPAVINGTPLQVLALSGWQQQHEHATGLVLDYYLGGEMLLSVKDGFIVVEAYAAEPQNN